MKQIVPLLLAFFALAATSCHSSKEEPEPVEPVSASFTRSLDFPKIALRRDTTYTDQAVLVKSFRSSTWNNVPCLALFFKAQRDTVKLLVPTNTFQPSWTGTYLFNSAACPTCLTQGTLVYSPEYLEKGRKVVAQLDSNIQGSLTITAYNSRQKTISGSFQFESSAHVDLYAKGSDPNFYQLRVAGTFQGVSVAP
jgi:hypothetical protein